MEECHIENARIIVSGLKFVCYNLWGKYKWFIVGAVAFHLFEALLPLVHIYLAKELIDTLVAIMQQEQFVRSLFVKTILILVAQSGLSLVTMGVKHLSTILMMKFNHHVLYQFDKAALQKCNALSLIHFDISEFHNTIMRASNGAGKRMLELLLGGMQVIKSVVTVSGFLYIFYTVHWGLFILVLLMFLPSLSVNIWGSNIKYVQNKARTLHARRLSYIQDMLKSREAAKELRIFGHFPFMLEKWKMLFREDFKVRYRTEKKIMMYTFIVDFTNMLISTTILVCFFWIFCLKRLTIGEFTSYSTIVSQIFGIFQGLSHQFGNMHTNAMHINEFIQFMEFGEEDLNHSSSPTIFPLKEGISLCNVSFAYPNQEREVLRNISLSIRPGEKIAIVGDNGAGKSTLIKCLVGLYPVTEGGVYYDRTNISNIAYKEIRSQVSVIFQDFMKYDLTVKENIGIGLFEEINNERKMEQLYQKTGLESTIQQLPDGLDTELGYTFQTGRTLSGGEWQKIAIGRALFKDAEIVVLDEPTAALDPIAESRLLEKFISMIDNKTGIVISHRLGICRFVDRVVVLQGGMLVEEGSHEELLAVDGVYARMYSAQSKWYVDRPIAQHS